MSSLSKMRSYDIEVYIIETFNMLVLTTKITKGSKLLNISLGFIYLFWNQTKIVQFDHIYTNLQ